jgi:hypothetical protein
MQFMHLDNTQSVFFARQLEQIEGTLYEVKQGALESRELLSVKPVAPGAEQYTYRMFDKRGVAKIMSNYSTSSPRADVDGFEVISILRSFRLSFGYSIQEIRAAQFAGTPLDAMKAMAARRGIDEGLNAVALQGAAEFGIRGLFNQPNAQTFTVPADGTGSSALWATKTVDQILRDMFGVCDQIPQNTAEVEKPRRLLMPYSRYRLINRLRMGTGDGVLTVLKFFETQRPDIQVRGALFLDTAGAGATARMVAYDPNPINLEWIVAVPFETFPPVLQGMEYVTECHARAGGVIARYPLSICYGDGI